MNLCRAGMPSQAAVRIVGVKRRAVSASPQSERFKKRLEGAAIFARTDLPCTADEPFNDRFDRVVTGPLRDRAFDHLRDDDIAAFDDQRGRDGFTQTRAPQNPGIDPKSFLGFLDITNGTRRQRRVLDN